MPARHGSKISAYLAIGGHIASSFSLGDSGTGSSASLVLKRNRRPDGTAFERNPDTSGKVRKIDVQITAA
jgi:hypothetical protein